MKLPGKIILQLRELFQLLLICYHQIYSSLHATFFALQLNSAMYRTKSLLFKVILCYIKITKHTWWLNDILKRSNLKEISPEIREEINLYSNTVFVLTTVATAAWVMSQSAFAKMTSRLQLFKVYLKYPS